MPTNQLHPVYHGHSSILASRIDIDRILPADLDTEDLDEWLEKLSEPPKYTERIAPVSTVIGAEIIRGKHWTDMMMKCWRSFLRLFGSITYYNRQALVEKFSERAMVPFTSCDIDPDTIHRMVELDYEQGENTYGSIMELFRSGIMAPAATVPFHVILPLLDHDFDRRLLIRMGLLFYWPLLMEYQNWLKAAHGDRRFLLTFWLPECGYSKDVLVMLHEEFMALAKKHKLAEPHLIILLDNTQAKDRDTDVMMKSWNQVKVNEKDVVTALFRDRSFSEWVTYSSPSVKKLIDRTIAKVDSELNEKNVDYCWGHYEEIETLTFTSKSAVNFEQKIVKLAQLSYLAVSPDFFVRRKMSGKFGLAPHEPQEVLLRDGTSWQDNHTNVNLGRWLGVLDSNANFKLVDENRNYLRRTRLGKVQELGPQCWKLALVRARQIIAQATKGDPETMEGGFLGILAEYAGHKDEKITRRNVTEFLVHFTLSHWREHFLQHDMSEADVEVRELVDRFLLKDTKRKLTDEQYLIAGTAAQGYYFILDAHRSGATAYENLDNRATYQCITMLMLGLTNLMYIRQWREETAEVKKLYALVTNELLGFRNAFDRYRLADYGVTMQEWTESIKSQIDDSPSNVVERAARRLAARHLKGLGFRKDFTKEDEFLTTNTGHIWSIEIENTNYKWENKIFCGLREE